MRSLPGRCKSTPAGVDVESPAHHHDDGRTARLQIIGVIDLIAGRAVHARAGARERYAPLQIAGGREIDAGNARQAADIYTNVLGITDIYTADLDAIQSRQPQDELIRALASFPATLWLDAGARSLDDARRSVALGATRVIVGLETLPSLGVLSTICTTLGSDRVAFSLDLRNGQPIVAEETELHGSPEEIAALATDAGVRTIIVIDLARVGTASGPDIDLLTRIRSVAPDVNVVAGGGVRGWNDLVQLARAGCGAALVATALHDGRIGAAEISEARML